MESTQAEMMNKQHSTAQLPTCLKWNKLDIQAQGLRHGLHIDDAQAQDLLEGFFEEANSYIIMTINIAMAEYVRENYEEQS